MANAVEILIRARDEASAVFRRASENLNRLTTDTKTAGGAAVALARDYGIVPPQIANVVDRVNAFVTAANSSTVAASQLADEFPKLASQGIATSQGLAAIGAAAQHANVDFGVVNAGLLAFKSNLAAAQSGTGPAYEALTRLGFSASEIGRGFGSTSNALATIGPRIAANTQVLGQAADATALFGKSGAQLIPILPAMGGAAATASIGFGTLAATLLPIAGIILGLVAAVGVLNRVLDAAVSGAKLADQLGDLGEKVGLTAEDMSNLAFAASQSDTSVEALSSSMKFLSRNLVEARIKGSEARGVFIALGLSAEEIDGGLGNARDALLRVADAVAATKDPIEKTAIATKLLGRSADELVPFLNRGSVGILSLFQAAERLRGASLAAAAATGDDFTKALARLQFASDGVKFSLAAGIIPTLTELVETMTDVVAGAHELAEGIGALANAASTLSGVPIRGFFEEAKLGAIALIPGLSQALVLMKAMAAFGAKSQAEKIAKEAREFIGPPRPPRPEPVRGTGESEESFSDRLAAYKAEQDAIKATADAAKQAAADVAKKAREEAEALRVFAETLRLDPSIFTRDAKPQPLKEETQQELERKRTFSKEDLSPEQPELEVSTGPIEAFRAELQQLGIDVDALNEKLVNSGVALESLGGIGALTSATLAASLSQAFDPYRNAVADAQAASFEFADSIGTGIGGALTDIFVKGRNVFDSLGKFIRSVMLGVRQLILEITAAIAKAAILRALGFGLFAAGGAVGRGGGGTPISQFVATGGPIRALAMGGPAVRKYAMGGAVGALLALGSAPIVHAAGGLALPGGPSISDTVHAMLSPGEYVVPNFGSRTGTSVVSQMLSESTTIRTSLTRLETVLARGSAGGGGGGRNVTIAVSAFDGESTRRGFSKGGKIERQLERLADEGRL